MSDTTQTYSGLGTAPARVRDYIDLLKPRVMSLVVFTGLVGVLIAPVHLHPFATALAVRLGCKILASSEVLEEASVVMTDAEGEDAEEEAAPPDPAVAEAEVERFREFLQDITPEDFGADR